MVDSVKAGDDVMALKEITGSDGSVLIGEGEIVKCVGVIEIDGSRLVSLYKGSDFGTVISNASNFAVVVYEEGEDDATTD